AGLFKAREGSRQHAGNSVTTLYGLFSTGLVALLRRTLEGGPYPPSACSSADLEGAVARVGRVLPPRRTRGDELHHHRLRRRAGLVPDEMDGPAAYVEERVRPVRRVHVRRAGRIVAVVFGHR